MLLLAAALLWQWLAPAHGGAGAAAATATAASTPAMATGSTAPPSASASAPLLERSLLESRGWLARQEAQQLSVHIATLPAADRAAAEAFLQQAQQAIGLRDLHVFHLPGETSATGHAGTPAVLPANASARLLFVYGSFADRASAEALWTRQHSASPQKLLLIDMESIRTEMKAVGHENH